MQERQPLSQHSKGVKTNCGNVYVSTADLTLPHPAMHERRFVLAPLAEIAPAMTHPVLKLSVIEMLRRLD